MFNVGKTPSCQPQEVQYTWSSAGKCVMPGASAGASVLAWYNFHPCFGYTLAYLGTRALASYLFSFAQAWRHPLTEDLPSSAQGHCEEALPDKVDHKPSVVRPEIAVLRPSRTERTASVSGSARTHLSWLPPLRFQLPATSEEKEEDLLALTSPSRPLLTRSQTCATRSSSTYSRNTACSGSTVSRKPSTLSSLSSHSLRGRMRNSPTKQVQSVQRASVPTLPARYRHRSHSLRNGGRPVRPGSRPSMPPAEFWRYAERQQMRLTYISNSESYKTQRTAKPGITKREPSVCRYPIIAPPAMPVCRTRRATIHSETAHIKSASYESLRKGTLENVNSEKPLAFIGRRSTHMFDVPMDGTTAGRCHGETGPKTRISRTLTKKRQPDHC